QIPIAITSYLRLIFWPRVLTLYHSELIFSLTQYFIRLALFIIFLGIVIYSLKKSRRVFFGFSLFLISLLPTLTPLGITWVVAERYVYLGSIGIFLVFALFINRLSKVKRLKIIVNVIFFLIIAALLARTIIRNVDWRNEDNLWIATGKASPSSPNTHNNLGDVYGRQGNSEKSIEEFKKAIAMKPDYADAYHNLANAYQGAGKIDEAIENYKKAIKFNTRLWQSYQNLGAIYFNRGDTKLAEEYFKKVVQIRPGDSYSHTNMGVLYLMLGKKKEAKAEFQEALNIEPNNQRAREGLNLANQ
ncbi:MAG: tetratricopeptide repeat protein, partial [Candidatus Omnitrophica bacterium]|nr:tetratricopeptide repeat protein [Candidatus Omnitrophota bacterium]